MQTNYYQEKITFFAGADPARVQTPVANICKFHAEAGTISILDIWTDFISAGTQKFTMRINGVDQFPVDANRPVLTSLAHVQKSALSFAVLDGDLISFDLVAVSSPGLYAPVYFRIGIDVAGGGGGSGVVETIVAGSNITVDDTDPANPIVSASGGGGSTNIATIFHPDVPYTAPSTEDDEFNSGSLAGKWGGFGASNPTVSFDIPSKASMLATTSNISGYLQLLSPGVTREWAMKITVCDEEASGSGKIGFMTLSSSFKRNVFYMFDGGPPSGLFHELWSSNTVQVGQENLGDAIPGAGHAKTIYLKLKYTHGTTFLEFYRSVDGITWAKVGDSTTYGMAGTLDYVGIFCGSTTTKKAYIDWFRRVQGGLVGNLMA